MTEKRIALFGGTFDPFHNGHLSILKAAEEELDVEETIVMPAYVSPFKQDQVLSPAEDRIAMARLAIKDLSGVRVSTREIDQGHVSYTYETLHGLTLDQPGIRITFLVGTDSFLDLPTWYRGTDLLREFSFALAPRPGFRRAEFEQKLEDYRRKYGTSVCVLHNEAVPVSSREIREAVREGKDISRFVPAEVEAYIYEHRLYQSVPERASV